MAEAAGRRVYMPEVQVHDCAGAGGGEVGSTVQGQNAAGGV